MCLTMHKTFFLLASLACAAHGRRVHTSNDESPSSTFARSQQPIQAESLKALAMLLVALKPEVAFNPSGVHLPFGNPTIAKHRPVLQNDHMRRGLDPEMQLISNTSLAAMMFGDVVKGVNWIGDKVSDTFKSEEQKEKEAEEEREKIREAKKNNVSPERKSAAQDLDERAQTGEITFRDFMQLSEAWAGLNGQSVPGMPEMTPAAIAETRERFQKHEKIVEAMLDEELDDPELLIGDLRESKDATKPSPRIERLASSSGESTQEVMLFLMQFEGMRESTMRIAQGENPDDVTESMGPAANNRKGRRTKKARAAAKKDKKEKARALGKR